MNLAEFPITLLTEHGPRHLKTLEFEDLIQDPRTDQLVTRKLTVTASDKYGLPTARDDDVILGLILLTKQANNFTERTVYFSRYQLIRLLGWRDEGKSYRRLEDALDRWMTVTLLYDRAWWDNECKSWVDAKFHILEDVFIYEKERPRKKVKGQTSLPFSSFTWSNTVFQSFQSGYLRRLRLDFYLELETPTSKRLYRFLDKHFYHRPRLEFDLEDLAFAHVGLSRGYHTGKIKEKLTPAIRELEDKGFLEPIPDSQRYLRIDRGHWKVIFLKKQPASEEKPTKAALNRLEKELIDRSVTPATAAELVAASPPEKITAKLEVFDWMKDNNDKRLSQNPAGYLVKSITDDYTPPKGYQPKVERDRLREENDAKQHHREEAARRKEAQETAARQARRDHINSYVQSLSPADLAALEQQALAKACGFDRQFLGKEGPMAQACRQNLIDAEVLRLHPLPPEQRSDI